MSQVLFPSYAFGWNNQDKYIFTGKDGRPMIVSFGVPGDNNVRMLDGKTGELLWSYEAGEGASVLVSAGDFTAVTLGNEVIYLETRTGKIRYHFRVIGHPLFLAGNNLVVSNDNRHSLIHP